MLKATALVTREQSKHEVFYWKPYTKKLAKITFSSKTVTNNNSGSESELPKLQKKKKKTHKYSTMYHIKQSIQDSLSSDWERKGIAWFHRTLKIFSTFDYVGRYFLSFIHSNESRNWLLMETKPSPSH